MKYKILNLLRENTDFISGQKISSEFGVSRTAIWKNINALKADGYEIEAVSRKGYKLISSSNLLSYEETKIFLNTQYMGRDMINLSSVDSTNQYSKELAFSKKEGTVVTAEHQLSGKGRLGRSWASPSDKGIYLSIILKPNLDPTKVAKLTLIGAASVYKALKDMNIDSQIKWPNDILLNGKKVCGILTEMSCELNIINYIVMGIGINVNLEVDDIPYELREKATSLKLEIGESLNRNRILGLILNNFESLYDSFKENQNLEETIKICVENSNVLGKQVQIIQGNHIRIGTAIDINKDGELVVKFESGIENIFSGEVSVRGLNGYI